LELKRFRLDSSLNWIKKTGFKKKKASQPVTAMAGGSGAHVAAYIRTDKHTSQD
jgi:hypothetical protein